MEILNFLRKAKYGLKNSGGVVFNTFDSGTPIQASSSIFP